MMIRTLINGFCMVLADSVPGVSGGTIALILGFYDNFIGSIHDLIYAGKENGDYLSFKVVCRLGSGNASCNSGAYCFFLKRIYMLYHPFF